MNINDEYGAHKLCNEMNLLICPLQCHHIQGIAVKRPQNISRFEMLSSRPLNHLTVESLPDPHECV